MSEPPQGSSDGGAPPERGAARARIAHQPSLDGIRGVAVTFVLASHAGFTWARGGFLWVSTFFTLSGFLIATLLLREHAEHGSIGLRSFWRRRFRRLMPAALLALAGIALFGATVADGAQLARLRGDGLAALAYVANWRFIVTDTGYADLFASPSPVLHFWTLSIEEQLYLLLPLGVAGTLRWSRGRRAPLVVALGLLCIASLAWTRHLDAGGASVDRLYFGTDTRLPELLAGVLLAVLLDRWRPGAAVPARRAVGAVGLGALGLMLVWTATVLRTDPWLYAGGLVAYAALSSAVITAAWTEGTAVRRLLSLEPLPWLGRASYGTYLYHWPVFLWLDEQRTGLSTWPLFALRVAVTLGLAALSLRVVEQPIRAGTALVGARGRGGAAPAGVGRGRGSRPPRRHSSWSAPSWR